MSVALQIIERNFGDFFFFQIFSGSMKDTSNITNIFRDTPRCLTDWLHQLRLSSEQECTSVLCAKSLLDPKEQQIFATRLSRTQLCDDNRSDSQMYYISKNGVLSYQKV